MRRLRRGILIFLLCAATAIIAGGASQEREPQYGGKSLSAWLRGTSVSTSEVILPAPNLHAVREIGTNALPFLLKRLKATPSHLQETVTYKLPLLSGFASRDYKQADEAIAGFYALSENAEAAIPELVGMVKGTNTLLRYRAALSLACIGKPATPMLLDLLLNWKSLKSFHTSDLIEPWALLGTNAASTVPILIAHVNDDDQDLGATSSTLLAQLAQEGVETNLIGQAVWKNLDSPKVYVRYGAITVLAQLGDRRSLPSLQKALSDPEPSVRSAARDAILKLAPEALAQSTRAQSNSKEVNNPVH